MTDDLEDPTYVQPDPLPTPYMALTNPNELLAHDLVASVQRWDEERKATAAKARELERAAEEEVTRIRREVRESVSPLEIEENKLRVRVARGMELLSSIDPNAAIGLSRDLNAKGKKKPKYRAEEEED